MSLKDDYQALLRYAKANGADPLGLFKKSITLETACMEGLAQERVNMKSEDGKDVYLELYPQIAAQCQQFQYRLFQDAEIRAGQATEDTELVITVSRAVPRSGGA